MFQKEEISNVLAHLIIRKYAVFGPFPKVAHSLHEKSAKDDALCKRDKKRTGNLLVSGVFWSR